MKPLVLHRAPNRYLTPNTYFILEDTGDSEPGVS